MAAAPVQLGNPLVNDEIVYRAFSADGFRDRKANKVRAKAYYRYEDHTDGLSVGLTPEGAVADLKSNHGYCSLSVTAVNALPYGLSVRPDLSSEGHALICNLPFLNGPDAERERAALIAGELARRSVVVTCDSYPPAAQAEPPLPV